MEPMERKGAMPLIFPSVGSISNYREPPQLWTSVPMFSPESTRFRLPTTSMLNT